MDSLEEHRQNASMKLPKTAEILMWVGAGAVLNVLLAVVNRLWGLPLFLDSIFTAVLAAVFGPYWGSLTAVVTQLLNQTAMVMTENQAWGPTLPFVLCQLVTALVIGFMARSGHFQSTLQLIIAIVAVSLGNSVVGSFVATFVFGGIKLANVDFLTAGLILGGQSLLEASFWARVPINLIDKGLAVVTAYLVFRNRPADPS